MKMMNRMNVAFQSCLGPLCGITTAHICKASEEVEHPDGVPNKARTRTRMPYGTDVSWPTQYDIDVLGNLRQER
jgi:hypothetical protein